MVTVGEVFKNKRENLKISLDTASSETKIQKRFLQYIEKNEFSPFESEVFLTGFIKIYAKYLNLDVNKVLALYRRTNPNKKVEQAPVLKQAKNNRGRLRFTPKTIITILLILFAVGVIGYILFQIYRFQSPPKLEITQPKQEETVTEETIIVEGKTEKEVTIEINGVVTELDEEGNFSQEHKLTEGVNIITIKAKKNNNDVQETVEVRKVTYTKPTEEEKPAEIKKVILLEIFDSAAWIRLDIDDVNQLAQVVEPSKKEYEFKEKIYIKTGRLSNTKMFFNGKEITSPASSAKGIAEMTCTLSGEALDCK